MSESFTFTTTGWEMALLLGVFFASGAYTVLCLTRHHDPDRKLPKRQGDMFEEEM